MCLIKNVKAVYRAVAWFTLAGSFTPTFSARDLREDVQQADRWLTEALSLREQGRGNEAEPILLKILAMPAPPTSMSDPYEIRLDANRLVGARWQAQRQLGAIQLGRGEYALALKTFRTAQPPSQDCGNGAESVRADDALWQGICLENLDETDEAIELYAPYSISHLNSYPEVARRLEAIYRVNGKIPELMRFADLMDDRSPYWREMKNERMREEARPTAALRRWIQFGDLVERRDWRRLVAFLAESAENQRYDYAYAAVDSLTEHPNESVPLLIENWAREQEWTAYALGLCATPDAVAFLMEQFKNEYILNSRFAEIMVRAMSHAGEIGTTFLADLGAKEPFNLLTALMQWREGKLYPHPTWRWPAPSWCIPHRLQSLPTSEELAALAEARER